MPGAQINFARWMNHKVKSMHALLKSPTEVYHTARLSSKLHFAEKSLILSIEEGKRQENGRGKKLLL